MNTSFTAFLHHVQCLIPKNNFVVETQFKRVKILLHYVSSLEEEKKLFPGLCCSLNYMKEEVMRETNEICKDITGPETAKYLETLLKVMMSDVFDLICGRHSSSTACDEREPTLMSKIRTLAEPPLEEKFKPSMDSLIEPLVRIAKRFDGIMTNG